MIKTVNLQCENILAYKNSHLTSYCMMMKKIYQKQIAIFIEQKYIYTKYNKKKNISFIIN